MTGLHLKTTAGIVNFLCIVFSTPCSSLSCARLDDTCIDDFAFFEKNVQTTVEANHMHEIARLTPEDILWHGERIVSGFTGTTPVARASAEASIQSLGMEQGGFSAADIISLGHPDQWKKSSTTAEMSRRMWAHILCDAYLLDKRHNGALAPLLLKHSPWPQELVVALYTPNGEYAPRSMGPGAAELARIIHDQSAALQKIWEFRGKDFHYEVYAKL